MTGPSRNAGVPKTTQAASLSAKAAETPSNILARPQGSLDPLAAISSPAVGTVTSSTPSVRGLHTLGGLKPGGKTASNTPNKPLFTGQPKKGLKARKEREALAADVSITIPVSLRASIDKIA
jgi:hypothetical protein